MVKHFSSEGEPRVFKPCQQLIPINADLLISFTPAYEYMTYIRYCKHSCVPLLAYLQIKWAADMGLPIIPIMHKAFRGVNPFSPASEAMLDATGHLLFKVYRVCVNQHLSRNHLILMQILQSASNEIILTKAAWINFYSIPFYRKHTRLNVSLVL